MGSSGVTYTYLIGEETTRGVAATADKDIGIITNVQNSPTRTPIICEGIGNKEQEANKSGMESGSQTITMDYQHGRIFEFLVGAASHVETTGDWVHTFTVDALPPSFTAGSGSNLSSGDVGMTSVLNVIESLALNMEIDSKLKVDFTTKGRYPVDLVTVPAHIVSALTCFPHGTVSMAINAVDVVAIQSMTISVEQVVEAVDGFDDVSHVDLIPVTLRVKFDIEVAFNEDTFQDHGLNNDITAITLDANNNVVLGSGRVALDLALKDIEIENGPEETASVGGLTFQKITGNAKIDTFTTTDNISSTNWL